MSCPSPLILFQFAQGAADPADRAQIAAHVARCRSCAVQVERVRGPAADSSPGFAGLADALEPRADDASTRRLDSQDLSPPVDEDSATRIRTLDAFDDSATVIRDTTNESVRGRSPWSTTHSALARGTPVGRYLVVEPLGSGGLGDVYTAYDPELDRCVAVKVLRPPADVDGGSGSGSGTSSGGGGRLVREAKALARLAHPNVVSIYDVGRVDDDVFIAMERVEGMTLSQWCRAEQRPWREIRDVFLGAGAGLAAAHQAGIIHRDFKPQNVIVDPEGRPRVLDFGLARSVRGDERHGLTAIPLLPMHPGSSSESLDSAITMEGTVMGTPQFMAPEQYEGADHTGPAADQFAYCVALWGALYGERPFQGETIPELIHAVQHGEITEPPDRGRVPGWLHKVLLRGLSIDPGDRFPSMDALLFALQRDRRSRRRQWIALVLVAVLSTGGTAAAAIALQPPVTAEHRDAVETLAHEAESAAARSYYVYPAPDDEDRVTAYRKILELEAHTGPAEDIAEERATQLRREFSDTLERLGDRYFDREGGKAFAADYYAAALIFDPDNERARARTSLTPGEVSQLRDKAAEGDFTASELAAAASLSVLAVEDEDERKERLVALYSGDQAPSPSTTALFERLLGDEEVEQIAQAARPRRARRPRPAAPPPPEPEEVFLPTDPPEPEPGDATGGAETGSMEADTEAEPGLDEGSSTAATKRSNPAMAATLAKQGDAAFGKGDFQGAEALYHRALSYNRRNSAALGGLAALYFERGGYQKAAQFGSRAVNAAPKNGKYRIVLGDAYFKTLAYQSARREYEKAKALGHPSAAGRLAQLDKRLGK